MSLRTKELDPRTTRSVRDAATYLDEVVAALDEVGVRASSIEIDARHPLTARLVVAGLDDPETLVLDWRRDGGWWVARRRRPNARPTGWRQLTGDPRAAATDVAAVFQHDLRPATA